MEVTQRTFRQADRVWYVVESEAGAVTFFTQSSFMSNPTRLVDGKKVMAGDLGYHHAEDEPSDPDRWMDRCDFTKTKGCRYEGFQSGHMLDLLADEGLDALFAKLALIHANSFANGR